MSEARPQACTTSCRAVTCSSVSQTAAHTQMQAGWSQIAMDKGQIALTWLAMRALMKSTGDWENARKKLRRRLHTIVNPVRCSSTKTPVLLEKDRLVTFQIASQHSHWTNAKPDNLQLPHICQGKGYALVWCIPWQSQHFVRHSQKAGSDPQMACMGKSRPQCHTPAVLLDHGPCANVMQGLSQHAPPCTRPPHSRCRKTCTQGALFSCPDWQISQSAV